MSTYYATIGYNQSFNGKPDTGYVEIETPDETEARRLIREATGNRWAFMYRKFDDLHPFDRTKLGEIR